MSRFLEYIGQNRVFRFVEIPVPRQQVHTHKKDSIRETQTMNVGQARRLTPRTPRENLYTTRPPLQTDADRVHFADHKANCSLEAAQMSKVRILSAGLVLLLLVFAVVTLSHRPSKPDLTFCRADCTICVLHVPPSGCPDGWQPKAHIFEVQGNPVAGCWTTPPRHRITVGERPTFCYDVLSPGELIR